MRGGDIPARGAGEKAVSITAIIALVRDGVILGALGYILWFIHHADANAAKVRDLSGVVAQLNANALQEAAWQRESKVAETQRQAELANIAGTIAAQRTPLFVRIPTNPDAVSGTPPSPSNHPPGAGGDVEGSGRDIDVRQRINAFETELEGHLADCRAVLNSWPKESK
jgi:hypothetical protein